jgi:hypothetical protein
VPSWCYNTQFVLTVLYVFSDTVSKSQIIFFSSLGVSPQSLIRVYRISAYLLEEIDVVDDAGAVDMTEFLFDKVSQGAEPLVGKHGLRPVLCRKKKKSHFAEK